MSRRLVHALPLTFAAIAAGLLAPSRPVPLLARRAGVAAMADTGPDEPEHIAGDRVAVDGSKRRGLPIWTRIRRRARQADDSQVDVLEGVAQDIDSAMASRRRRLRATLGKSLKGFREEVLNEVELQANETKERKDRLRARQVTIQDSLGVLRQDLLDEIDGGLAGVKRGGETIERALREMRSTWEHEVNDLVNEARTEVDLVVSDLEEAINMQREEWAASVTRFERAWLEPVTRFNASRTFNASAVAPLTLLPRAEIDTRISEVKRSIDAISDEVETDLLLFKQRWEVTTDRLEALPSELPKLKSLAAARMYVADTIFAGDVPALLTNRSRIYQDKTRQIIGVRPPNKVQAADPLGLREAAKQTSNPVLTPTAASNLRLPGRHIAVVTTAALPWMTGTSINPLLRAAYLSKAGYNVSLVVPWLKIEQQPIVFPGGLTFERPAQQEQYVRWWCENRASVVCPNLRIRWYPAKYAPLLGCIIQDIDDITDIVPPHEQDAVILEEPEHLNWYHHGRRWTDVYKHVVGIAHTNYLQYCRMDNNGLVKSGRLKEPFTRVMNNLVCAAHTDIVVKLSATLPDVPGENLVCNVHGVRAEFLAIGRAIGSRPSGAYFLGKADYTKGYRELIDNLQLHQERHGGDDGALPPIDTFGSGKDYEEIVGEIERTALPITPHAGIDHAHPAMHDYRVFINPSTSDVLCTATAEALAMGKSVVIPDHPSNIFFAQFANTHMYRDPVEMVALLRTALATEPAPLSPMEEFTLSWEAASERLLDAAALPAGTRRSKASPRATAAYYLHYSFGVQPVFDVFRTVTGAEPKVPWSERASRAGRVARIGGRKASKAAKVLARRDDLAESLPRSDAPSAAPPAAKMVAPAEDALADGAPPDAERGRRLRLWPRPAKAVVSWATRPRRKEKQ